MWHSVSYWVRWVDNCNYFHNSWNIYYVTQCQLTGKMVWQFQHFCGILQYSFTFMLYTFLTAALSLWLCLFCCGHCSLFCGGFAVALFPGVVFCGRCFRVILGAAGMCLLTVRAKRALACRKQMAGPKGPPVPASERSEPPSVPSTIPQLGEAQLLSAKRAIGAEGPDCDFWRQCAARNESTDFDQKDAHHLWEFAVRGKNSKNEYFKIRLKIPWNPLFWKSFKNIFDLFKIVSECSQSIRLITRDVF